MITIPDNPTLEWAEEQADKLVLAQWAIFKDLEKLCGLAGGFQPAERSLISQYLVFGRHSFPKSPVTGRGSPTGSSRSGSTSWTAQSITSTTTWSSWSC